MLIKITKNAEGIEDYLETGRKKGRDLARDDLDRRVHIGGNLDTFSAAVEYTQKFNSCYCFNETIFWEIVRMAVKTLKHSLYTGEISNG